MAAVEEGVREAGVEVREGGVAVGDDDAGVTADVAEGLVVRAGDDVAAVAAHEAELGARDGRERVVIFPIVGAGARRGTGGVGVGEERGWIHCWEMVWILD